MRIHATNDFAADVPTAFAMLTDPVFLRATCLVTDPLEHSVAVEGPVTRTRRVMPTPSVVSRLAGPTMAVVDQITWHPDGGTGTRAGDALITVEGLPAKLVGTVRLQPGGRGAVLDYDGELTVDVPLLGPSLAKQAAPLLIEALELQQRVGDQFLTR
ncbi:MAG: DUF2505 domain-containing protein [Propionibacteriaceae bacterium]|jgi:hypothetical protein|nr:DUF2505 domain-containing protein [Propionibacteriaceae bacterium]